MSNKPFYIPASAGSWGWRQCWSWTPAVPEAAVAAEATVRGYGKHGLNCQKEPFLCPYISPKLYFEPQESQRSLPSSQHSLLGNSFLCSLLSILDLSFSATVHKAQTTLTNDGNAERSLQSSEGPEIAQSFHFGDYVIVINETAPDQNNHLW